jgi:transposase-like protein
MTLHFLLKAEARTLSPLQVAQMSEERAVGLFRLLRWGDAKEIPCPHCGVVHRHYWLEKRQVWKCAACREGFSVTTKTKFAYHKLPLRVYLYAVSVFVNAVKGISALQMARDLGIQHKSAFVILGKVREALMETRDETPLTGQVHMDGAYVGGKMRPENKKEDRVDRRLAENQSPDKRCILVMRQNYTLEELLKAPETAGAKKTLTFILKKENQADIGKLAPEFIAQGARISADESDAYDLLHAKYDVRRVNHSVEYRAADGTTNNQAESFFSRFRRLQIGQIHKVTAKYLGDYANEIAYREDTRRTPNGSIFFDVLKRCAQTLTSRDWCGYWQGNHRHGDGLSLVTA